jgi:hypothetical protein
MAGGSFRKRLPDGSIVISSYLDPGEVEAEEPVYHSGQSPHNGSGGTNGQPRFTGTGAPGVITGAVVGDVYLDLLTGKLYKMT